MVTPSPSLRERSKVKRRRAIQRAALELFAQRGYDGATINDIAQHAEVAPRTVTLYFPTKLDIAMSFAHETVVGMTATFHAHPQMAFTQVLDLWLRGEEGSIDTELATLTAAMLNANPPLRAIFSTVIADAADVGGSALIAETGLPRDHPLLPVVSAVVAAALSTYLDISAAGSDPALHQLFIRYIRSVITDAQLVSATDQDGC